MPVTRWISETVTDFSGVVAWESGDYRLMLSYMDNSGGELWINYSYRPEK